MREELIKSTTSHISAWSIVKQFVYLIVIQHLSASVPTSLMHWDADLTVAFIYLFI